jgi:transposase InsO family protein
MHAKAPLTPEGRRRLCERIEAGWTIAGAADSMGISRQTAHKWWRRYREAGEAGLIDRSSRPRNCPRRLDPKLERRLVELRRRRRVGPARLAAQAGISASTMHRVLQRNGVSRLSDLDPVTGRVIRRIETSRPGELVHIDVKKLAKIPPGGGWRVHGRGRDGASGHGGHGYVFVHSAIDAYSRLAYSEIHANEQGPTAVGFWRRALAFYASYGIVVERVLTDNGGCYRSFEFRDLLIANAIVHTRTRPYHPQTNGKIERFNRTLRNEWAYARPYRSNEARSRALDKWLHLYNHHRYHTAIKATPASLVNNLSGQNN